MNKLGKVALGMSLVLAGLVNHAAAEFNGINAPEGRYAVIAQGNAYPRVVVQRADGSCTSLSLKIPRRSMAYSDVYFETHETVEVAATTFEWCGFTLSPPNLNGSGIGLHLGPGNNTFYNLGVQDAVGFGGDGNDAMISLVPDGTFTEWTAHGEMGDDLLYGAQGGVLEGWDGYDIMCVAPGETLSIGSGGDQDDILCGAAQTTWQIEWYDPNCAC